jgi:hypothetical protein
MPYTEGSRGKSLFFLYLRRYTRMDGHRHFPATLLPSMLVGPQGRCGHFRKITPLAGLESRTFQPVAIRSTGFPVPILAANNDEKFILSDSVLAKYCI